MEYVFVICIFVVLYVYFLFPLLLKVAGLCAQPVETRPIEPFVTLFVAAYNEGKVIKEKLENSLSLNYPVDKLEIVVASDGSTDNTTEIVNGFSDKRVILFESLKRGGKNSVINEFINRCKGEVIVFTDANSFYQSDTIKNLVRNFADPNIGCVVGNLRYIDEKTSVAKGEGLYFRYESKIKEFESRLGAVVAATGSIYAIRRELFLPLDFEVANDFAHPIQIASKGYNIVFEPDAIAYEKATSGIREEFRRRTRIVTRGITAFMKYFRTYRMLHGTWGFCFISHKLLRWFIPFFLIAIIIINLTLLESPLFRIILYAQLAFYSLALIGIFLRGSKFGKPFTVPFYFCLINTAALVGIIKYFTGNRQAIWETAKSTR